MAPYGAAREAHAALGGAPDEADIELLNSFAKTGKGHGTHAAVAAGLLGYEARSPRYRHALEDAARLGVAIKFSERLDAAEHPNVIYFDLRRGDKRLRLKFTSLGGGNYDLDGDFTGGPPPPPAVPPAPSAPSAAAVASAEARAESARPVVEAALALERPGFSDYKLLAGQTGLSCVEFALLLETHIQRARGGCATMEEVWASGRETLQTMLDAVGDGLSREQDTRFAPGDWGARMAGFKSRFGGVWDAFAAGIAAQEHNGGMGFVAAAPTCGASGTLPGVLYALKSVLGATDEQLVEALFVAGLVGQVAFSRGPVSGAQAGCGGEIGVAAMMASAAAAHALGGGWEAVDSAAALVGQLFVGLECSPALGLVEYPCIPRNGFAAVNALLAAEMACCGARGRYSADETLDRIFAVGRLLPQTLREFEDGSWMGEFMHGNARCGGGGCGGCS